MMAMTPIGTAVFSIKRPFGRTILRSTAPTGSGRAATSRIPLAMSVRRPGVSARRSSITSLTRPRAFSTSCLLASRILSCAAMSATAIASSAAFFVSASASASGSFAPCAARKISCVVMGQTSLMPCGPRTECRRACPRQCRTAPRRGHRW